MYIVSESCNLSGNLYELLSLPPRRKYPTDRSDDSADNCIIFCICVFTYSMLYTVYMSLYMLDAWRCRTNVADVCHIWTHFGLHKSILYSEIEGIERRFHLMSDDSLDGTRQMDWGRDRRPETGERVQGGGWLGWHLLKRIFENSQCD